MSLLSSQMNFLQKAGHLAVQEIAEAGGEAYFYRGDISNAAEMCGLAEEIRLNHGGKRGLYFKISKFRIRRHFGS